MAETLAIDVLWLVEHVVRELDVACAASLHLAAQGRSVAIEPVHGNADRIRAAYAPGVVVTPYCYSAREFGVRDFVAGWAEPPTFFNLSWEQLYYGAYLEYKAPHDAFAREQVIHHAWGGFFKEYLARFGVPEHRVRVNGNPAYALFEQPYRHRFKTRTELAASAGLDPAKRWVFFPENYRWAFYQDVELEGMITRGMSREDAYGMRAFCCDSLVQTMLWLIAAARDGSVEVILRPRPTSDVESFEAILRELSPTGRVPRRLHVIKSDSVREWLMASDVACSSYSTTMIEAAIAGKPAYFLEPIPIPTPLQASWHARVPRIHTRQQFLMTAVTRKPDPSASAELERWARSEMLGHGDPIAGLARIIGDLCPAARPTAAPGVVLGPPENIPPSPDRFTQRDIDAIARAFDRARLSSAA